MPEIARSTFIVEKRQSEPAPWEGGQLARTQWHKLFSGDLIGTSVVEAIMVGLDAGPRVYVGVERFTCRLHGRAGTFVLLHAAAMHEGTSRSTWTIVDGSGTEALVGLRGAGEITPGHDFILTYELA